MVRCGPRVAALVVAAASFCQVLALPVLELTEQTFDTVVDGSSHVLVMFTTDDCGHCKKIEPEYEAAAGSLLKRDGIVLAQVNTGSNSGLAARFDITGHPIFRWFPKGSTRDENFHFVHYSGRMANTLLTMVGDRVPDFERQLRPLKKVITQLKDHDFDTFVYDRSRGVFVYFTTAWGDRLDVRHALDKVGRAFDGESGIEVAKLEISNVAERDVANRYALDDFPAFVFFDTQGEWEVYSGPVNDAGAMVGFINKRAGTLRTVDGKLSPGAGKVTLLEPFAKSPVTETSLAEAKVVLQGLSGMDQKNGAHYIKIMERVLQKGSEFPFTELTRLRSLLAKDTISEEKKTQFLVREAILESFVTATVDAGQAAKNTALGRGATPDEL